MIRFARPARKRSGRKQKRLARMRSARPTLQERRVLRDIRVALWKEVMRAMAAQSEDAFPGFSCVRRETFGLALERSLETGGLRFPFVSSTVEQWSVISQAVICLNSCPSS